MNDIIIRPAMENDIDSMCGLYYEFHQFHVHGVPDRLKDLGDIQEQDYTGLKKRLVEILNGDDCDIIVAEYNGRVIGLAELEIKNDNPENNYIIHYRYGFVENLMVTEKYRRKNVGQMLLDASYAWAIEKGAAEVRLDVWDFPAGPRNFYEKLGFRTMKRTMIKKL